jgi:hypothetical protein
MKPSMGNNWSERPPLPLSNRPRSASSSIFICGCIYLGGGCWGEVQAWPGHGQYR